MFELRKWKCNYLQVFTLWDYLDHFVCVWNLSPPACPLSATFVAYGSSQARDWIWATTATYATAAATPAPQPTALGRGSNLSHHRDDIINSRSHSRNSWSLTPNIGAQELPCQKTGRHPIFLCRQSEIANAYTSENNSTVFTVVWCPGKSTKNYPTHIPLSLK